MPRRRAAAIVALCLAVVASGVTVRNWRGVLREEAASFGFDGGEYEQAGRDYAFARVRLIDPVRQLINHGRVVRTQLMLADATCQLLAEHVAAPDSSAGPSTTAATPDLERQHQQAVDRCTAAHHAATELWRRAPTLMDAAESAASSAELLARLYAQREPETARQWGRQAGLAWRWQRTWRPYDFETLLALTHYNPPLAYHFGLLRDALRATDAYDRWGRRLSFGQMRARWNEALELLVARERFPDVLRGYLGLVGPVDPETDIDMLILSGAPEVYRLAAHAAALEHEYGAAQDYAARAAPFYWRLRPRFPTLYSIALLEQADFALRDSPERAQHAADLLRAAIGSLPVIQEQKHDRMVRPFRRRLIVALLAGGDEAAAVELLRGEVSDGDRLPRVLASGYVDLARLYIRQPPARRPDVIPWLRAALRQQPDQLYAWSWLAWLAAERGDVVGVHSTFAEAARSGVAGEDLQQIRRSLCDEFPALCEQIKVKE